MKIELKIIKKTKKNHLCFGCFKTILTGSACWCLKTIDNGEDFRWFHGEQCYNEFEARELNNESEVQSG